MILWKLLQLTGVALGLYYLHYAAAIVASDLLLKFS